MKVVSETRVAHRNAIVLLKAYVVSVIPKT